MELIVRHEGRRLVTRRDLRRIWGVADDAIKSYASKGLPKVDLDALVSDGVLKRRKTDPNFKFTQLKVAIYDLAEVNAWRDNNVDMKRSPRRLSAQNTQELPTEDTESDATAPVSSYALREMIAKTNSAEEQATILTLKRKNLEGSLVESDDLDKAMAEQAVLHKTDKLNDEKVLPTLLEGKTSSEISDILQEHNQERLDHFDRLINKEFKDSKTLYDIIEIALTKLEQGVSPSDIIKAIDA